MSRADEPAFPMYSEIGNLHAEGLTKLEYFSAMAMQSIVMQAEVLERNDLLAGTKRESFEAGVAEGAVALARALIAELDKANVE